MGRNVTCIRFLDLRGAAGVAWTETELMLAGETSSRQKNKRGCSQPATVAPVFDTPRPVCDDADSWPLSWARFDRCPSKNRFRFAKVVGGHFVSRGRVEQTSGMG